MKQFLTSNAYSAGGGLIDRRALFALGAAGAALSAYRAKAGPLSVPDWSTTPGLPMSGYGTPSPFEAHVQRDVLGLYPEGIGDGAGVSFTPLERLEGTITPNGLFFERHHSGIPEIDPMRHELVVHGMVRQPRVFSVDDLMALPAITRVAFLECAGNSLFNSMAEAQPRTAGGLHGLISQAEWSGVLLSDVLDLVGIDPDATWLLAEGSDAAKQSRSIPLSKVKDGDAMIALYQNGERLRPEQGYPMRLVLPGWQGSMQTKWLRRIKAVDGPTQTKDETSKYSLLRKDGRADQFTFQMGVKSVITRPSPGMSPRKPGLYQISGLAWSGAGRITRVEISADRGLSWAPAALDGPVLPQALTRFRIPWVWEGQPTVLMSRAIDETGAVQPMRADWYAPYAAGQLYHNNAIQAWSLGTDGDVINVYV